MWWLAGVEILCGLTNILARMNANKCANERIQIVRDRWSGRDSGGGGRCTLGASCFAESQAAAVKLNVIAIEKAMGRMKRYLQLTTVMAAKQRANDHVVPRMSAKVAGECTA